MRLTHALVQVAVVLLTSPDARHWGYATSKRAGVRSGVTYPLLTRMLNEGWLMDGWENPTTLDEKRPPRRYYELTASGRAALTERLEAARTDARFRDTAFPPLLRTDAVADQRPANRVS
jgi:PadR family transcriptional regulator PadR